MHVHVVHCQTDKWMDKCPLIQTAGQKDKPNDTLTDSMYYQLDIDWVEKSKF